MTQAEDFAAIYRSGEEATIKVMLHQYKAVQDLSKRVAELEQKLNKNSENSSKPPSSDGYKKPPPKNLRHKSGKKSGGQDGHAGKTLEMVAKADHEIAHWPNKCSCCGECLTEEPVIGIERRQVHDLPPIKLEVTEHQSMRVRCRGCGETTQGAFPENVTSSVQYGSGMKGLMTYLSTQHLLPMARTVELLGDVVNSQPSEGTLMNTLKTAAKNLTAFETLVKAAVLSAKVVHFDETGLRVMNSLHWLHVASTATLTYYAADKKRGKEAHCRIGILPLFKGTGVHDAYSSYWGYDDMQHSLCNVHLGRELKGLQEMLPDQSWPESLYTLLNDIHAHVTQVKTDKTPALKAEVIQAYQIQYRALVQVGLSVTPLATRVEGQRGRLKKGPARNLLERLDTHENEVLRFMHDFNVPFENNQAERDIRMTKVKQKVSGCFRSLAGAEIFCRTRSYISTLGKQGMDILGALRSVFDGVPIMPAMP